MKKVIVSAWDFIFDHDKSPLRHIPDMQVRHMVFQILGWIWAFSFAIAIGSYTFLAYSLIGHAVLIAAATITVATYATAARRPTVFASDPRR